MLWRLCAHACRRPAAGIRTLRALRAYRRAQETLRALGAAGRASGQCAVAARSCGLPAAFIRGEAEYWMEQAPLGAVRRARYPGVLEFCRWAAERRIRLAALSDYDPRAKLRALEVEPYLSAVVCAQDHAVNCFKPAPAGLERVLALLGADRGRVAYIGDRPEIDGRLAQAAGVHGILLGAGGWRAVLAQLSQSNA